MISKFIEKLNSMSVEEIESIIKKYDHTDFYERWVKKLASFDKSYRMELLNKVLTKYDSDVYYSRWYKRGIEPPKSLLWIYYEFAKKYGTQLPNDGFCVSATYSIDGVIVERLDGQGSVIMISKDRNLWFPTSECYPSAKPYCSVSEYVLIRFNDGEVRIDRYDWDYDRWEDNYDSDSDIKYWCNIPSLNFSYD